MRAILLIGGLGTRLRPLTFKTPKPLLPILNRPFLAYQIEYLKGQGIDEIVLCTAYRAEAFREAFGSGAPYGVQIHYVHEREPLGTGGAIKNAESYVDGPVLVCNGDILTDMDLSALFAFHREKKALATIALTRAEDPTAFGLVNTDNEGRIQRFTEKPSREDVTTDTINAGTYIFEPRVFALIPKGKVCSVERDVFPDMLRAGERLYAKALPGYWLDVGTLEKYRQAERDLSEGRLAWQRRADTTRR
jgi:NDP-sugar pyrophosphorylase family protein